MSENRKMNDFEHLCYGNMLGHKKDCISHDTFRKNATHITEKKKKNLVTKVKRNLRDSEQFHLYYIKHKKNLWNSSRFTLKIKIALST